MVADPETGRMASLVEDRLFRPSSNRGVFGLSGEGFCDPTLERPENICCTPTFTLLTVDGGRWVVDLSGVDRLGEVCRVGAMTSELSCLPLNVASKIPNSRQCRRIKISGINYVFTGMHSSNI